jgi:putative transposase
LRYDPSKHHRRSIRLAGYHYGAPGAYYVTLVVRQRACLLGGVRPEGVVSLSEMGQVVKAEWLALPGHFRWARLDQYVIMPNHLHGIIVITGRGEAPAPAALNDEPPLAGASPLRPAGTQPGSLGAIVQNFKSVSARRLNGLRNSVGASAWQRNYYEHVVRGPADLDRIRAYILNNPIRWAQDPLNSRDHD